MFYLCESEATATTCSICAKAKRQQQHVLSVRKRSDSNNMFYLCESEATATKCFICAKAKRQQQQMFSVATATKGPVGTEINPRFDDDP